MFDEMYPEAADLAMKTKVNRPPTAPKAPEFSTWGMFRGLGTGLPAGAAQGIASTGEMLGAFGTTLATTGGSAGGMFQLPTEAEQKQHIEATDKLIKGDELFAGGEVTRSFRNAAEGYKPDPTTTHTAEQVVFNFARVGGKAITAAMTMGNVPGAIAAGAEEGFTQAEELKQQGVDIGTRTKVGAVTAVTNAVGFALPVAGKTWLQTAGLVAVGGPGTFVTQQAATKAILENANYADLAKQYDPTDKLGLAMSVLLPGAFGALAMRGAAKSVKAKGVPPDTAPAPDAAPVPDAPTAPMDYPDADLVDAARVSLVRQHMDAANPMPDNVETAGAHNAAYSQALDQVAAGERVAVADVAPPIAPVAGKATDTPNFKAWFGDSKVVDDTGAPMVVYHATGKEFDSFQVEGNYSSGAKLDAAFFSSTPEYSNEYATLKTPQPVRSVPVYLAMKNPLDVVASAREFSDPMFESGVIDRARAAGYDGVVFKDSASGDTFYAVFDQKKIKSAIGNSGKFDPESASLTDNPMADWGAGVNRALADMAKTEPKPAPALADTAQAATKTVAEFMAERGIMVADAVESSAPKGNAFVSWLKNQGGVSWAQKVDIVGERGVRGNYAGIFTKKGQNLDTLVESAVQAGYLTRADLEASGDVGGTRALSELIRRATTGEKIATVENADASRIAQGQARAAMDAVDDMERELRALGVDPSAARGNADALGAYLAEHRTALVNKKLAEIDAETKAERIATGEAYNLSPKQIDAQTRIALAGELDENAMHQAAMVARDEVDFLNRVEEIINNAPGSRKTIQSSQGSAADASIPARDGQAAADATTSASGFNPAALAADAARFLEGGKSAAQVIGELEAGGAKASPELQNMLIGVAEFGGRINELADQVSALKAQRGAGTKPFELVAQAVENMRTGTKVEAPKPKTPTEARFADLQARNPDVMDKPMQFDVDENGNAAGPATTAREYLERIQREADQDTADASLIEVAANCFLSGGM